MASYKCPTRFVQAADWSAGLLDLPLPPVPPLLLAKVSRINERGRATVTSERCSSICRIRPTDRDPYSLKTVVRRAGKKDTLGARTARQHYNILNEQNLSRNWEAKERFLLNKPPSIVRPEPHHNNHHQDFIEQATWKKDVLPKYISLRGLGIPRLALLNYMCAV